MRRIFIICIILTGYMITGCGREPSPVTVTLGPDTTESGRELISKLGIPEDQLGYIVYDMDSRKVLQSHNRDVPFIPASVTKIITILAALDILGPDYRFLTFVITNGEVSGNRLNGDIFLKGTGDPLLTIADFMLMARRLRELGIREITGGFFYDETALQCAEFIDREMEEDVSYNPGISPLSLEYNTFIARWEKDKKAKEMKVTFIPSLPFLTTGMAEKSPGKDIPFALKRHGKNERWLLSPEIERDGSTRLPVHDPGRYAAHVFAKICRLNGITVKDPKAGQAPAGGRVLVANNGRSLLGLSEITLTYSNNIMAELMLLASARKLTGKSLDFAGSGEAVSRYVQSKIHGVDWRGFHLANGSGLTSRNGITPDQMLGVLLYADSREYDGRTFLSMLPASGWEWSMLTRLYSPETALHIWAKTGTINYAIGLAGYLFTNSQKRLLFAYFITDRAKREAYEREPDRRERSVRNRAYYWIETMKDAMDEFLEHWIAAF